MKAFAKLPEAIRSLPRFPVPVAVAIGLAIILNLQEAGAIKLGDALESQLNLRLDWRFLGQSRGPSMGDRPPSLHAAQPYGGNNSGCGRHANSVSPRYSRQPKPDRSARSFPGYDGSPLSAPASHHGLLALQSPTRCRYRDGPRRAGRCMRRTIAVTRVSHVPIQHWVWSILRSHLDHWGGPLCAALCCHDGPGGSRSALYLERGAGPYRERGLDRAQPRTCSANSDLFSGAACLCSEDRDLPLAAQGRDRLDGARVRRDWHRELHWSRTRGARRVIVHCDGSSVRGFG